LKKIVAILLLCIHIFNITGYTAVFNLLQRHASVQIVERLDQGAYSDAELVEVKIPIPLPYSNNWKEYERCNGEFEWSGVTYNYVKRKLYNDTLYLLCIPNHTKTKITALKNDYAGNSNDFSDISGAKKTQPVSSLNKDNIKEYNQLKNDCNLRLPANIILQPAGFSTNTKILAGFTLKPFQPPKFS